MSCLWVCNVIERLLKMRSPLKCFSSLGESKLFLQKDCLRQKALKILLTDGYGVLIDFLDFEAVAGSCLMTAVQLDASIRNFFFYGTLDGTHVYQGMLLPLCELEGCVELSITFNYKNCGSQWSKTS